MLHIYNKVSTVQPKPHSHVEKHCCNTWLWISPVTMREHTDFAAALYIFLLCVNITLLLLNARDGCNFYYILHITQSMFFKYYQHRLLYMLLFRALYSISQCFLPSL